jgi:hypothetical protein
MDVLQQDAFRDNTFALVIELLFDIKHHGFFNILLISTDKGYLGCSAGSLLATFKFLIHH